MRIFLVLIAVLFGAGIIASHARSEPPSLASTLSKPIKVDRATPITEIPFSQKSGMIYLQARVNDFEGEFVFDTGSPTVIDQSIADQLDLQIIGENTGRDANGNPVTMKIALADSIALGGTVFRDVPVLVHDYSTIPMGKCFLPNGVLGSELLPGSAWQINTSNAKMKIAASIESLPAGEATYSSPLFIYGYPYAPIVDYSIGDFSDKALFDTGNSSHIALFSEIEKDKQARKQIVQRSVRTGSGRHGTSAGGVGDLLPLKRFDLRTVAIGSYDLGRTPAQSRPIPPTLIGAGILKTHIITLDYPNHRFLMAPLKQSPDQRESSGFALMVTNKHVEVSQLFDSSKAHAAGVRLGDKVVAIDGTQLSTSTEKERCETSLWLSNEFDAGAAEVLTIQRNDKLIDIAL